MSSWSSLAQSLGTKGSSNAGQTSLAANSSATTSIGNISSPASRPVKNAADSFELFKQQAKERQQMMGLLKHQEEQRRLEREQAEKDRLKFEREKLRYVMVCNAVLPSLKHNRMAS